LQHKEPQHKPPASPKYKFETAGEQKGGVFKKIEPRSSGQPKSATKTSTQPTLPHTSAPPEGLCVGRPVSMLAMDHTKRLLRIPSRNEFVLVEKIDNRLQHPNTAAMPGWEKKI